jgi:malonate transporter and related proteins
MAAFWQLFALSAPLFGVVLAGYALASLRGWRAEWTAHAGRFVFTVALPALLFHLMSGIGSLPPVDARLLIAFFGGCLLVFALGRAIAALCFGLDRVAQAVFGLAGVFSNNVLLGVPLAKQTLGAAALPPIALVLVFNSLTLWTLITVSVEWARHGAPSARGFGRTALQVLQNPVVAAILAGTLFGLSGLHLPDPLEQTLAAIGRASGPAALLVLGMTLTEYGVLEDWRMSLAICALKLVAQPLVVWGLALVLGLPTVETQAVVLLAALSVGVNVHIVATQYETLQGTIASSMVASTALAALTVPLLLALLQGL